MKVLGIETSCDETGIALVDSEEGLLAHALYSQIALHADYGGVVPELASRDHIRKTVPLIREVLSAAGKDLSALSGIAYTAGPGLVGALLVGASIARSLAWSLNIPAIGVHHMEGHLLMPLLENGSITPPFMALLVSGGHTLLVEVQALGSYRILGQSLDDAVGEAFDKTAKLLGLGYPGGPALAKLAERGQPDRFHFPRPMTDRPGLDFSFSGLKTFAMNTILKNTSAENPDIQNSLDEQTRADIAQAFEQAVVDTLVLKCRRALQLTGLNHLIVAGGVGANLRLRERLNALAKASNVQVDFPSVEFCTDNGAMIAHAGMLRLHAGQADNLTIRATPRWQLDGLSPI